MNMATGLLVIAFKTADMSRMVTGLGGALNALAFSRVTSTARLEVPSGSVNYQSIVVNDSAYRHASRTRRASPFVPAIFAAASSIASLCSTL